MKKIMFNDRYGLTEAVLSGRKTMTRRGIKWDMLCDMREDSIDFAVSTKVLLDGRQVFTAYDVAGSPIGQVVSAYHVGEVVAVAQKYWDLRNCDAFYKALEKADPSFPLELIEDEKGCYNKMFVKAAWMPHHIRITDIGVERLQDISDDDCRREGIIHIEWTQYLEQDWNDFSPQKTKKHDLWTLPKFEEELINAWEGSSPENFCATDPRTAFIVLFAKLSKKTPAAMSELNPWVFVYSFELID